MSFPHNKVCVCVDIVVKKLITGMKSLSFMPVSIQNEGEGEVW